VPRVGERRREGRAHSTITTPTDRWTFGLGCAVRTSACGVPSGQGRLSCRRVRRPQLPHTDRSDTCAQQEAGADQQRRPVRRAGHRALSSADDRPSILPVRTQASEGADTLLAVWPARTPGSSSCCDESEGYAAVARTRSRAYVAPDALTTARGLNPESVAMVGGRTRACPSTGRLHCTFVGMARTADCPSADSPTAMGRHSRRRLTTSSTGF
jgi:hypothetical protein